MKIVIRVRYGTRVCKFFLIHLTEGSLREFEHFGNQKYEKLLKCPIFNGEHYEKIEICISQLIAEILSIFYFNRNFMADLSSKMPHQLNMTQHI